MNCTTAERYLDAFLDGEVDASAGIEVERHLASCQVCADRLRFAEWLKRSVKQQQVKESAPADFRSRMEATLEAERSAPMRFDMSWRATAAAAAVALCVFGVGGALEMRGPAVQTASLVAPILEDVLRAHARAVPTEVAQRDEVPAYFQQRVGFAVKPMEFGDPEVRFVGARDIQAGGRKAATMQYEVRGRRMTVVAFRPPVNCGELGGAEEASDGRKVRFVRVQGHLVPLVEHDGVLYAVLGDLEPEARMAMATRAAVR